ncbi:MAG: DNA repair exonuclease [Ruminococcaceae bacterium]|nr:DNA repair exonuclease [Oscillospiraceae bacterium]
MLKILHVADLHLDTVFSLEDVQTAELRRNELRAAFVNLMMFARSKEVDVLLISGDLFDRVRPSKETEEVVLREFSANSRMQIFLSPGNHDPYTPESPYARLQFPENVHIFKSEELTHVDLPEYGMTVWGYAFTSSRLPYNPFAAPPQLDDSRINILVGHADVGKSASDDCPVPLFEIARSGFDYLALGHIHAASGLQREGYTYYAYPGCLEGRDFGECGPGKGALIAVMQKKRPREFEIETKMIRFARRRYEVLRIKFEGTESAEDVITICDKAVKEGGYGEDTLLRLILEGQLPEGVTVSKTLLQSIAKRLFYLEVKNRTEPAIDIESLKNDPTLRGAYYSALAPLLNGSPEEKKLAEKALRYGLAALSGSDIIDFGEEL